MPKKKAELTEQEELFVAGIVLGKSQAQAYVDAGYSAKSANSNAARLRAKERIKSAIESRMSRILSEKEETARRLIAAEKVVAFQTGTDIVDPTGDDWELKPPNQLTEEAWATITAVEISPTKFGKKVKITRQDPQTARAHLAKLLGLVKDSLDLTSGGKPIRPAFILVPDDNGQCNPINTDSPPAG